MSESQNQPPIRPWHAAWWVPELSKDDRQDSCHRVADASAPKPSYYVLIVLSTLIAAYGLVSNSTATVIGAMIVAPLMGPILGLALGTVLGDIRMFRRSLVAESTGAVLVILTGMLVAVAVGTGHIDYKGSEIAGRTSPTLFDLAIGLAAGLAGAYCTVHPGLQASVAGVAIAVALVPPLAVTGLTGAGWLAGESPFEAVFGSFMLFFTNLLTIELASGAVFMAAGFRHIRGDKPKAVWKKTLVVKTILLLLTGWFLYIQLTNLFQERYGLSTSRDLLETMLKDIPGADLDSLEANLNKNVLTVRAVVGSRTDIEPPTVARFQSRLDKAIKKGLPDVTVRLVVRTVNSTYASANGYLFEPRRAGLNDDDRRAQTLDVVLRDLISRFPGVDLVSFNLTPHSAPDSQEKKIGLSMTVSTPYDFGPRFVKDLEQDLNQELKKDPLFTGRTYQLLVRSVIIKNATSKDAVAVEAPEMRTEGEKEEAARTDKLRALLTSALEI
ncbi:MAG: TIGR00341 family protein, partial [Candidatus Eremiobacteraeota bacterium]|nr:TIGR00341 family protein [Candidatus Eremiobacteraeota bacterium]